MALKIIQLPRIGQRAFDVFNYRFIWERRTFINNEKQMYMHPMDDPIEMQQVLPVDKKKMFAMVSSPRVLEAYGQPFQSVVLTTHGKVAFKYGRIDFHVNLPALRGLWAALWMLREYKQWPQGKPILPEIDILEWLADGVAHNTIHYYVNVALKGSHKNDDGTPTNKGKTTLERFSPDTIYMFSMDWNEQTMSFLIDDVPVEVFPTPDDMQAHFHVLMNIACGGNWPDAAGYFIEPTKLPDSMEVHKVTIASEDFLYDIPASCSVLNSNEHLPTLGKRAEQAPKPAASPVSAKEQTRAEQLIADARTRAQNAAPAPAPTAAAPLTKAQEQTAVSNHTKLSMKLLRTGWFIHHHPKHVKEIVHHYLTGQKTHPNLDTPEFVASDATVSTAWGGVLLALRLVGSSDSAAATNPTDFLKPSPGSIETAKELQQHLQAFINLGGS